MKISKEDVVRVAELAHLELSPAEVETYREQLDGIISYIDKLNELDVTNVAPMAQVLYTRPAGDSAATTNTSDSHPELREDTWRPSYVVTDVLAGATDAAKPFFRVPRVIEK
jgi:aspartyl-tRNA(Asn)/glutamyl-tRNA(Gln) amidotransferase subunit C